VPISADDPGLAAAIQKGVDDANASAHPFDRGGARPNGTQKGNGWLGRLVRPDGKVSTELTAGYTIDGRETDIPLIVPTLTPGEVRHLLTLDPNAPDFFAKVGPSIEQKALAHARERMAAGKSPYSDFE